MGKKTKVLEGIFKFQPYRILGGPNIGIGSWKTKKHGMIGSVFNKSGEIKVVSSKRIHAPFNPQLSSQQIIQGFESISLRRWSLIFNPVTREILIIPYLEAAGRLGVDGFKGHLTRRDLDAARRELQGEVIARRSDGMPWDHVNEVRETQNGLLNLILRNKRLLTKPMPPEKREELTKELQKASKWLDYSEKFVSRNPGEKQFHELLQKTGLTKSYNANHPDKPVPTKGGQSGEIGGVGCGSALIEGLFDKPASLFDQFHAFFIPTGSDDLPFSNQELGQILYELAVGIYIHDTVPFFSLHFNQETNLYPVIHPVYQKTLVGQIFSFLDYEMKGYLNGAIFPDDFVKNWSKRPFKLDEANALKKLIDLKSYSFAHLDGRDKNYLSVRMILKAHEKDLIEEMAQAIDHQLRQEKGVEEAVENPIFRDYTKFTNSFRIIAKQNKVQKTEDLLILDPDFDVEYTIIPDPEYKNALELYYKVHGSYPIPYLALIASYEMMKEQIHDHMVKMPFCKKYFSLLGVIHFFSCYFKTLKHHRKIPLLPEVNLQNCESPSLFPSLPLLTVRKFNLSINLKEVVVELIKKYSKTLKGYLNSQTSSQFQERISQISTLLAWENLYGKATSPVRRHLNADKSEYLPKIQEINIPELIKGLFDGCMEQIRELPREDLPSQSEIVKRFLEKLPKIVKDENLPLFEVSLPLVILPDEQTNDELEIGKRVVGGCGMVMTPMQVEKAVMGKEILDSFWAEMEKQPLGQLVGLSDDQSQLPKGAAFSLAFADTPLGLEENPLEMETLFDTMIHQGPSDRTQMNKALKSLAKNNKEKFLTQINQQDLRQVKDSLGRSLLHFAAMHKDPFYTHELLKKSYSFAEGDYSGYLPIHYAAIYGHLDQLKAISSSDNLNACNDQGATPLVVAVQHGQLEAVKFLLEKGAKGDVRLKDGYTVLHCAVHAGNEEIVRYLLENSSEVRQTIDAITNEGITPLMVACQVSLPLTGYLIRQGANPKASAKNGKTALDIAVKNYDLAMVQLLFPISCFSATTIETAIKKSSFEINQLFTKSPYYFTNTNAIKDSPLHLALRYANLPLAEHLLSLSSPSQLVAENLLKETPIQLAAHAGAYEIVEFFLKKMNVGLEHFVPHLLRSGYQGGNEFIDQYIERLQPNQQQLQKFLLIAAEKKNILAISNLLLPLGVDLDQLEGKNGWKIEHYLARADAIFLFKQRYWAKGKDPFFCDKSGKSLAYIAAENSSWRVFRLLLDGLIANQSPLTNHSQGRHLFYAVLESQDLEKIQYFFDQLNDHSFLNLPLDSDGIRAVHLAATFQSTSILAYLCEKGTDLAAVDEQGRDALLYAIRCQNTEVVQFLIDKKVEVKRKAIAMAAQMAHNAILMRLLQSAPEDQIQEAMLLAIRHHNLKAVQQLINHGVSVDFKTAEGWTPFLVACEVGDLRILKIIFPRVKAPSEQKIDGNGALHLAYMGGHGPCIRFLVSCGFDLTQKNHEGKTPCDLAENRNELNVALMMVHAYNEDNFLRCQLLLESAILSQDLSKMHQEMDCWPINSYFYLEISGLEVNGTLLHLLLKAFPKENSDLRKIVWKICSSISFDPSIKDGEGNSYSHLMVKAGIDPTQYPRLSLTEKDRKGKTPLHLAASHDHFICFKNLIDTLGPAQLDPIDDTGKTPLSYAILNKQTKNAKILIESGCRLTIKDHQQHTPLLGACAMGNFPIVKMLVEKGADINQKGSLGNLSPLMASLLSKSEEIPLYLIKEGADLSSQVEGMSLIKFAASRGKNTILRLLAAKDLALTDVDDRGFQAIHYAASSGKTKTLCLFDSLGLSLESEVVAPLEKPTKRKKDQFRDEILQGATPLHLAAMNGTAETVKWLIGQGADLEKVTKGDLNIMMSLLQNTPGNSRQLLELLKDFRLTDDLKQIIPAIQQAIVRDAVDSLKLIYDLGIPIHAELEHGMNGLHIACMAGSLFCTSYFLKNGINSHLPTRSGDTPLELAAANRSVEQFRLLVRETQPDLDLQNNRGETLLHIAIKHGNLAHVLFLLDEGVDFDKQDVQGKTPLFIAVEKEFKKIVALLMLCEADAKIKTTFSSLTPEEIARLEIKKVIQEIEALQIQAPNGGTPLHVAVQTDHLLAVKLISRHVDVNQQNEMGQTALHVLCSQDPLKHKRQLRMARQLMSKGADITLRDNQGRTALELARKKMDDSKIVRFLEKANKS